jgi:hypothetical protein
MNSRFVTMYDLLINSSDDIYLGGFFLIRSTLIQEQEWLI